MQENPTIYPLDHEENIYALVDGRGNIIGTGSREVCEVLLYIVAKVDREERPALPRVATRRSNVKSAISI